MQCSHTSAELTAFAARQASQPDHALLYLMNVRWSWDCNFCAGLTHLELSSGQFRACTKVGTVSKPPALKAFES